MSTRAVQVLFSDSYWIRLAFPLLKRLSGDELIMLSYLINWSSIKGREEKWFYCKMRQLMDELNMSSATQTRHIRSLREKGYITTKHIGMPAARWIKVNWEQIEEHVVESCNEISAKRDVRTGENRKKKADQNGHDDEDMTDVPFDDL